MATILVKTIDGKSLALTPGALDALRGGLRGGVSLLREAAYGEARTIWSAMIGRRPAAVVRANGASDVIQSDDVRQSSSTAGSPARCRHEVVR